MAYLLLYNPVTRPIWVMPDMTKSRVHMYAYMAVVSTPRKKNEGRSIVNIGYKKAH